MRPWASLRATSAHVKAVAPRHAGNVATRCVSLSTVSAVVSISVPG